MNPSIALAPLYNVVFQLSDPEPPVWEKQVGGRVWTRSRDLGCVCEGGGKKDVILCNNQGIF